MGVWVGRNAAWCWTQAVAGGRGPMVRRTVTLPTATVVGLMALGSGSLSAGIRALWASSEGRTTPETMTNAQGQTL